MQEECLRNKIMYHAVIIQVRMFFLNIENGYYVLYLYIPMAQ